MTKDTRKQEALVTELHELHVESVTARAEIKRQIEAEYARRLEVFRLKKAELMAKGRDELGVAKAKLGRAIGTTDWKTIEEMLELGRSLRPESVVSAGHFSWGFIHLVVSARQYMAWVPVDGEEFNTTITMRPSGEKLTHPGYAIMAQPGSMGTTAYTVYEGEEQTGTKQSRERYPDLIAWIETNPPEVTE